MFLDDESLSSLECVIYSTICVDIEQDGFWREVDLVELVSIIYVKSITWWASRDLDDVSSRQTLIET